MPADTPARSRASFDFKRTTFPLISLVLRTPDLDELQRDLQARLGESPDFFDQDLLVVNLSALRDEESPIDFRALAGLLRKYRVQPIGVHGGSPAQMQAAFEAGLVATPEVSAASSMAKAAPPPRPAAAQSAPPPAATATKSVVIDKPLRSGQRVYAKGADLIVLELVSFGAEVFADGNIHVYAPLRGRAVAGARGNADARIFSTCLEPQLVAIAGVYRTIETPLPADVAGKPAQVRRVGDSLLIEPL
ncbi:septum site-determining protein MinC [Burkholderiaceae bacterium FT117]|uniref:septum site-determining protein MinC n=1 Tax=Zeimonas sediminis TaxID=2944268 RepID=UPI00234314D0|nr:septum site-determining protein MinC [Zeimonas sediminis]MCM5571670.1 septum site-determining protein MinC [Zeimonas sediminis]